ncbi:hypothetical protein [Streptomyces achromogenes]|uniref:hypothetical protein n=1 Tax=Streptomyces achromogenes TaxID=67255 RepID=UPI0036BDA485
MFTSLARRTSAALLVLASTAACGSGGGPAAPSVPVATPTPKSMAELRLPLEAYLLDHEHAGKREVLLFGLRDDCVRKKGFTPPPMSVLRQQAADGYVRLWQYYDTRRYAISDRATARQYGYHLPPFTQGDAPPLSLGSLPKPLRVVMEVCERAAAEEEQREGLVAGREQSDLAAQLKYKDFTASRSDPRVLAVLRKWSRCMARQGYSYATPDSAASDGKWKESGERTAVALRAEVTPRETRTAMAEVDCVYRTNVLGVSFAVEAEYENRDIEKNAEALGKLMAANQRAARTIDRLWARGE